MQGFIHITLKWHNYRDGKEISVYRFKCVKGRYSGYKRQHKEFLFWNIGTLVVVGLTHISKYDKVHRTKYTNVQMSELKTCKYQIISVDNMTVNTTPTYAGHYSRKKTGKMYRQPHSTTTYNCTWMQNCIFST